DVGEGGAVAAQGAEGLPQVNARSRANPRRGAVVAGDAAGVGGAGAEAGRVGTNATAKSASWLRVLPHRRHCQLHRSRRPTSLKAETRGVRVRVRVRVRVGVGANPSGRR